MAAVVTSGSVRTHYFGHGASKQRYRNPTSNDGEMTSGHTTRSSIQHKNSNDCRANCSSPLAGLNWFSIAAIAVTCHEETRAPIASCDGPKSRPALFRVVNTPHFTDLFPYAC
jgi:hypothetical protein